jgi:hypothetical protein
MSDTPRSFTNSVNNHFAHNPPRIPSHSGRTPTETELVRKNPKSFTNREVRSTRAREISANRHV